MPHRYPSLQGDNQGDFNSPKASGCCLASSEASVASPKAILATLDRHYRLFLDSFNCFRWFFFQ